MENATKALLIAGSVLVALLLIAVGLRIFNSTKGTTESAKTTMDSTAAAMFNNKFTPYIGENKSKSQVINLANVIIANNTSNKNQKVTILYSPTPNTNSFISTDITTIKNMLINVINDGNYKIQIGIIDSSGIIKQINIIKTS